MSTSTEIARITDDRNTIRNKLVTLGLAASNDKLDALAAAVDGIANRGTPSAEVKEGESYTIQPGYYAGGSVVGVSGGGNYNLQSKSVTPTTSQQSVAPDAGYYGLSGVTVGAIPSNYKDVSSVTATASDVLSPATIVDSTGAILAGSMPNNGAVSETLTKDKKSYTIPAGYHNGSGKVSITTETKTATPTESTQTVSPSTGKLLSAVTVNPIPSNYSDARGAAVALDGSTLLALELAIGYDDTTGKAVFVQGTMPNKGQWVDDVSVENIRDGRSRVTIPEGYHNGTGYVSLPSFAALTTPTRTVQPANSQYVLEGYGGFASGHEITGTMTNNGATSGTITGLGAVAGDTSYTIPAGYTSGGTVSLTSDIEDALAAI